MGGNFALHLPAPPESRNEPLVHAGLWIQIAVVFSGCGGKITQIVSVSAVGFGPGRGTEPSWQLGVQLSWRLDDRLLTEVKASWVFYFCDYSG